MRKATAVGHAADRPFRDQQSTRRLSISKAVTIASCALLALAAIGSSRATAHASPAMATNYIVYIGTYTAIDGAPTTSKGIYAYRFNATTGEIVQLGAVAAAEQPSFLAADPSGKFLYAANEMDVYRGQSSGGVSSFSINRTTGMLSFLNEIPSRGASPAHIAVDHTGKYVVVSNYNGGSLAVFPAMPDGHLGEATSFVEHHGSSVNKDRQAGPHVHQALFSPDNRFVLSTDLGLDELFVYAFDQKTGILGPQPRVLNITRGFGPRHLAFSPAGDTVYLASEMSSMVTRLAYDAATGAMEVRETERLAPATETPDNKSAAEIVVSPSGKFVYASNRGDDFIAIFSVDSNTGILTRSETIPLGAKTPRNFALDPAGQWLWDANQGSDNIVLYRIDQQNGGLMPSGITLKVPAPTCVLFVPIS
jgi:6-phosphogluconolactonase